MNPVHDPRHTELKKEELYTSPASPLPLYELKMLQEYIHGRNLQNLGNQLPHLKKQMMLIKFFKLKKNQLVEVISRNHDGVIKTIARVDTVGRDFVMLKTLFTRIWIPYSVIHSAKTPFGIPEIHNTHQHVVIDMKLRQKLINNFGQTVAKKEILKQQFFEQLLDKQLVAWAGTRLTVYTDSPITGKLVRASAQKIYVQHRTTSEIATETIMYIKQGRLTAFLNRLFSIATKHKE